MRGGLVVAPRHRRGFTLLELLLVMAILVVLLSIALPSIEAMYGHVRVTAAVDQVRAVWAEARSRAIDDGQAYRFAVMPDTNRYRVAPDNPDFWDGGDSGGASSNGHNATPHYVVEDALREGIVFKLGPGMDAGGGAWTKVATFQADGTSDTDAEVQFHSEWSRPIALRVRSLTGAVTSRTLPAEGR
jgi:prepilin-type N-terminal cleavage/methylation domain-containing protein